MSGQPLTGYDNQDANEPGVRDQEVYLYQAGTRQLTCVSCSQNGPSSGVLDTPLSGEGLGLVVDRRGDWLGQYLAGSIPGWTPLGLDRRHPPATVSLKQRPAVLRRAPTSSSPRPATARRTSTSTSPQVSAAAPKQQAASR